MASFNRLNIFLLTVVFLFAACASDNNKLSGSIALPLDFDAVEVRLYPDQGIQILYTKPISNSLDEQEIVNLFVDNNGISIGVGVPIELTPPPLGHGTLTRSAVYEDIGGGLTPDPRQFPPVGSGTIIFNEFSLTQGKMVSGEFQIIFSVGSGGGLGDTLLGDFSAPLTVSGEVWE